jgi:hypothetical protein
LLRITEITKIERENGDGRTVDAAGKPQVLSGDTAVSMNLWAFTPDFFDALRMEFGCFLETNGASMTAEFYIPTVVQKLIDAKRASVQVLSTTEHWCGMTHRDDQEKVAGHIEELTARGEYPRELWV